MGVKKQTKIVKSKKIKVAINEFPPLVEKKKGKYSGFEIELWEKIAEDAGIKYSYVKVPFKKLLSTVESGKAEIGFAGITMNEEREERIDFSHPTFDSGLSILVESEKKVSMLSSIKTIFSKEIGKVLLMLLGFVVIAGHVIWLAERGSIFNSSYFPGIIDALWWGIVTVSSVGYGDFSPVTITGKIIGTLVIILGLAIAGLYIAKVSSLMTIKSLKNKIETPEDLKYKKVATKAGTRSEIFLKELGAKVIALSDINKAFRKLEKSQVDAVVFDSPRIMHYVREKVRCKTRVSGEMFETQSYGFILKENSPIREVVNREILKLRETGFYKKLYEKYF